jgi:hypothetical protein
MTYLVQLGMYAPLSDTWTLALDLNDGQTLEVAAEGVDLPPPALEVYAAGNPRLAGERVALGRYDARTITVPCVLGPLATEAALASALAQLLALQARTLAPSGAGVAGVDSAPRVALLIQPPGCAAPYYADVLALAHDAAGLGSAEAWVRLLEEGLTLELLCAPFLRGSRVVLDNLVPNPGMDQPAQSVVWADAATNANYAGGYSVNAGGAPTISGNTLTLAAGSDVSFGAASWGSIAQWAVAFTAQSAGTFTCWLHRTATNTGIQIVVSGTGSLSIVTDVAGATTTLASGSLALTSGTRYWLVISALPYVSNNALATLVQAQIFAYSSGAIGSGIGSALYGAVTVTGLQAGQCGFTVAGTSLAISTSGGTNPAANQVTSIGASGWAANPTNNDATATPAWLGWDGATTYPGGAWASRRALSLTAPPSGKLNASWAGSAAPVKPGGTVTGRIQVAQSGLSGTATVTLALLQYTSGGSFITSSALGTATAAQIGSGWYAITGGVTLAANCAQAALECIAADATAGASARATVWCDDAQLNAGVSLLPYCANRFPAAPAQVQFSGLVGDVTAPCQIALGTSPAGTGLTAGGSIALYAGRRVLAGSGAALTGSALVSGADGVNQQIVPDATTWGGMQAQFHSSSANYEPIITSGAVADYTGVYHVLARLRTHDTPATSQNIQPLAYLLQNLWVGLAAKTDRLGIFQGPFVFPFTGAAWQVVDAGQVALPPFPLASQADPAQVYVTTGALNTSSSVELDADWGALLPVDGDVLGATFQNNSTGVTLSGWIWLYFDGLATHATGSASATWSLETAAAPNPAHAGGGPGVTNQPTPALISSGDSVPQVDPAAGTSAATGVNQWVVVVTDNSASVLPVAVVLTYAPLYLEPR